jgi:hypothetical protein
VEGLLEVSAELGCDVEFEALFGAGLASMPHARDVWPSSFCLRTLHLKHGCHQSVISDLTNER